MADNRMELTRTDLYFTHDPEDAVRVLQGSVYVYIVPWSEETGRAGKRVTLCEVEEGRTIPSFAWRDAQYTQWRFLIMAKTEGASLEVMPKASTLVLKRNFLRKAGIETFEEEGFEASLAEFYHNNELKDDVYFQRTERKAPEERQKTIRMMAEAVQGESFATGDGTDQLYGILAFAGKQIGVTVPEQNVLEASCEEMTLPEMARVSQLICREVVLDINWQKNDCGVIIAKMDGRTVVLYPVGGKYMVYDPTTGKKERLTKVTLGKVDPKAWSVRRTLPRHALKKKDIIGFVRKSFRARDIVSLTVLGLLVTLIGVLQPKLNQLIYDEYIPMGETGVLIEVCGVIASFMLGNVFISIVRQLQEFRIPSRTEYELQDAVYWRLFQLPESFFRKYDSADLAERVSSIGQAANQIVTVLVSNGFTLVLSLIYLIQMFKYSSNLAWIGLLMIAILAVIIYVLFRYTQKSEDIIRDYQGKGTGKLYQFLNGVDKIRMAGAEERAILEYTLPMANSEREAIRKNRYSSFASVMNDAGPVIFSMVLYYIAIHNKLKLTTGAFMGFNTAFGSFTGGTLGFVMAALQLLNLKTTIKRAAPILNAAAEDEENRDPVAELKGDILLEHVSFGYSEDQMVLRDLSLHVRPGEYVALVGPSGCGKSTTLKLLLGFEEPKTGRVCYDGKDIKGLDKHSLRKRIGVVLQNGQLISGSIYDNITITAQNPKMNEVMQVIEDVGLKEDIDAMPMGIHTMVSEGGGTISGGQQQRILIARAIMSNPAVLYFDEATSALDNLTQAKVCESLEKRHMTRVVIAHRLSTVQNCDRIIVLNQGTVVEEGNFETLMAQRGMFYQMALRQIAE